MSVWRSWSSVQGQPSRVFQRVHRNQVFNVAGPPGIRAASTAWSRQSAWVLRLVSWIAQSDYGKAEQHLASPDVAPAFAVLRFAFGEFLVAVGAAGRLEADLGDGSGVDGHHRSDVRITHRGLKPPSWRPAASWRWSSSGARVSND